MQNITIKRKTYMTFSKLIQSFLKFIFIFKRDKIAELYFFKENQLPTRVR